jgi:ribose/xylose/arabinose/galactoside ABC-type transport system permease subunit
MVLLLAIIAAVGAVNHAFLRPANLRDMLIDDVPTVIVACGMTLVLVTGEIDISVGSLMGLLATVLGQITSPSHAGLPVAAGIAAVLLLGLGVGLINGFLVTVARMPSIIVTLAMLTILQGVGLMLMNGEWITDMPAGLRFFGIGSWLGIPVSLWTAVAAVLIFMLLASWTPLGRRLWAVGSNPDAARLAGLPARKLKVFAFAMTGLLTAVATVVSVPRLGVIESGVGQGFELLVITCVVVGGTSISGGRGTVLGSVLAVLLLGAVGNMLIFLHLGLSATYWERAIQGAFILAAVLADHISRRRSHREARA